MTDSVQVRRGAYHDSVTLMQVSQRVRATPGVLDALVGMGTELNLALLEGSGFEIPPGTGPNDLVVALRARDDESLEVGRQALTDALAELQERSRTTGAATQVAPRTVGSAARRGGSGIALVSTPGPHAVLDALDAVRAGLSVMLFSDNVPVADEIVLKDAAAAGDVLVMGPDCGTAVVGGAALGFANSVRRGRIGMLAASGTGAQQVMCLLGLAGEGISHCLGLGGRDLSAQVGGRSARQALHALAADEATEHVVVVSKPAADEVTQALQRLAADLGVPVSWATLGRGLPDLTAAVEETLVSLGAPVPRWPEWSAAAPTVTPPVRSPARAPVDRGDGSAPGGSAGPGRFLRGLYCGGTLADEAMLVAERRLGPISSNIPLPGSPRVSGHDRPEGHTVIDLGDDELTQGRAHPMIDPAPRLAMIREQGADASCGVLLLDLVLGFGAHPDPAEDLAEAIREAREAASRRGRELPVVVALVGTADDPQGLESCAEALSAAGASVHASNARAVGLALELLGRNDR